MTWPHAQGKASHAQVDGKTYHWAEYKKLMRQKALEASVRAVIPDYALENARQFISRHPEHAHGAAIDLLYDPPFLQRPSKIRAEFALSIVSLAQRCR